MVPIDGNWYYSPSRNSGTSTQGAVGASQLQGAGGGVSLGQTTGSPGQNASSGIPLGQNTSNPMDYVDPEAGTVGTGVDPAQAAAEAAAAKQARQAGILRGDVTNLVNRIKDIFNSRYGQVDAAAAEQLGKLNERFGTESGDLTKQADTETQKLGAAHAASGSFDSSYRGNNVDTVTSAAKNQIRDLGTELQENVGKVGQFVNKAKTGFNASKAGLDAVLSRLSETTDIKELSQLRNQLESRIAELSAEGADYATTAQNLQTLEGIAPTSSRGVQLKTTLSQIVAGNADTGQKKAIGEKLIASAGLSPEEQQALLSGFNASLVAPQEQQPQV